MKNTKIKFNQGNLITSRPLSVGDNTLTNELKSIFIGLLLGDGSLYRSSPTSNVRLEVSFGHKSGPWALHLGAIFEAYMSNPVKTLTIKGKSQIYTNYRLKTKSLPVFLPFFDMFYKWDTNLNKNIKIVPIDIIEYMDPIVLAYLIMGDGNWDKGRNRVRIYTNSFTKEEVTSLSIAINSKLNIYTGVLHDRKDQWILTIGAKNLELLRDTVSNHFHASMFYRIGQ